MAAVLTGLDKAGRQAEAAAAAGRRATGGRGEPPADAASHRRTRRATGGRGEPPADAASQRTEAAVALRDAAVLELFYATGIRVSELCGLDPGHFDHGRRTVRVRGKGDKERTVPVGVPALRAVTRWLAAGRPALATAASGPALFLGVRGGRLDPRTARRIVHERTARGGSDPGYRPARHPPQRGDPPARGRRRPAQRPGDPRSFLARDHPDLYARVDRAPQVQLSPGPSPGLDSDGRRAGVTLTSAVLLVTCVPGMAARGWPRDRGYFYPQGGAEIHDDEITPRLVLICTASNVGHGLVRKRRFGHDALASRATTARRDRRSRQGGALAASRRPEPR